MKGAFKHILYQSRRVDNKGSKLKVTSGRNL